MNFRYRRAIEAIYTGLWYLRGILPGLKRLAEFRKGTRAPLAYLRGHGLCRNALLLHISRVLDGSTASLRVHEQISCQKLQRDVNKLS